VRGGVSELGSAAAPEGRGGRACGASWLEHVDSFVFANEAIILDTGTRGGTGWCVVRGQNKHKRNNGGSSGGGGVGARSGMYPEESGNRAQPVEEMNARLPIFQLAGGDTRAQVAKVLQALSSS